MKKFRHKWNPQAIIAYKTREGIEMSKNKDVQ